MELEGNLKCVGEVFRLLSACFYEPEKQLFLDENLCLNLSALLKPINLMMSEDALNMQNALIEIEEKILQVDHAALFIGPFELAAPPYGSIYLEDGNQVIGESTIQVQRIYDEVNLRVDLKEPADHIAIELEFMSYLFGMELNAIQNDKKKEQIRLRSLQKSFFLDYMNPWIPELCQKIETNAETDFYKLHASILRRFSYEMNGVYLQQNLN